MGDERQHLLQKSENDTKEEPRRTNIVDAADPDGGLGWLVVLACFMTNFVIDGVTYSFGMLMKPLMAEMEEGNFGCATIGSIQVSLIQHISLIRCFNFRQLFLFSLDHLLLI